MLRKDGVGRPRPGLACDILVGTATAPVRYVEVKGTTFPIPRFSLSEGERDFSHRFSTMYTLLVIHAIDMSRHEHQILTWDGAVTDPPFALAASQWHGELAER